MVNGESLPDCPHGLFYKGELFTILLGSKVYTLFISHAVICIHDLICYTLCFRKIVNYD